MALCMRVVPASLMSVARWLLRSREKRTYAFWQNFDRQTDVWSRRQLPIGLTRRLFGALDMPE
jgi:hypothetical protein